MKKSLRVLFSVLLAVAVLVPVHPAADDCVPAPKVPIKAVEGLDNQ
jgi:hypothetical protein